MRRDQLLIVAGILALNWPIVGQTQSAEIESVDAVQFLRDLTKQPDGRSRLTVVAKPGFAQDSMMINRQAHVLADRVATRECPRGYDFYAAAPLKPRRNELTYVFKCR
jgi:hypothetical protein